MACDKQLVPGDEFALRPDGLFCKEDHTSFANELEENNNEALAGAGGGDDVEEDESQDGDNDKDLLEEHRYVDSGMPKHFKFVGRCLGFFFLSSHSLAS